MRTGVDGLQMALASRCIRSAAREQYQGEYDASIGGLEHCLDPPCGYSSAPATAPESRRELTPSPSATARLTTPNVVRATPPAMPAAIGIT